MQAVIVPWIEGFGVSRILPETDGIHYSRLHDLDSNLSSTKETSSGRQLSFHTWKLIGTWKWHFLFTSCEKSTRCVLILQSRLKTLISLDLQIFSLFMNQIDSKSFPWIKLIAIKCSIKRSFCQFNLISSLKYGLCDVNVPWQHFCVHF